METLQAMNAAEKSSDLIKEIALRVRNHIAQSIVDGKIIIGEGSIEIDLSHLDAFLWEAFKLGYEAGQTVAPFLLTDKKGEPVL